MNICFPVENDNGLGSALFGHFGSAPYFINYDTVSGTSEVIGNDHGKHEHGACDPVASLGRHQVDAVICRGMGLGAINKLAAAGISVLTTSGLTLKDALAEHAAGKTKPLGRDAACGGHNCH